MIMDNNQFYAMVLRSGVQPQMRKSLLKVKNKLLELWRTAI